MTKASDVSSWPIDASATAGKAEVKSGKFSRFRSCPILMMRPRSLARAEVAAQARNSGSGRPAPGRRYRLGARLECRGGGALDLLAPEIRVVRVPSDRHRAAELVPAALSFHYPPYWAAAARG
jgi:hypothetical protein